MNMHQKLMSNLTYNEDVFIYDEINYIAVTVINGDSLCPLYVGRVFLLSVSAWVVIDIQNTDKQGGQSMYNCLLKASNRLKIINVSRETRETEKRKL